MHQLCKQYIIVFLYLSIVRQKIKAVKAIAIIFNNVFQIKYEHFFNFFSLPKKYSRACVYAQLHHTSVESHGREGPVLRALEGRQGWCWASFKHARWGVIHHITVVRPEGRAGWRLTELAERLVIALLRLVNLGKESRSKITSFSFK